MTENTNLGAQNIAEAIRDYQGPSGERFDLHMQARRLRASLDVVSKWVAVADASCEEPGELGARAEYIHGQIEDTLSRVCFEIEVLERRRVMERMASLRDEQPPISEAQMRGAILLDSLIDAFVIVSESSAKGRYHVMGALRLAADLLPDEVEAKE